jgi:uncharacterized protein YajQ (UPF0234 family)
MGLYNLEYILTRVDNSNIQNTFDKTTRQVAYRYDTAQNYTMLHNIVHRLSQYNITSKCCHIQKLRQRK